MREIDDPIADALLEALSARRAACDPLISAHQAALLEASVLHALGKAISALAETNDISHHRTFDAAPTLPTGRAKTKKDILIARLSHPQGVSVNALETELGWSQGALSASLSNLRRDGYVITRYRLPGEARSHYRIVGKTNADLRSR